MMEDMKDKDDYYEIMGLNRDASIKDIKTTYKKLCRQFHPDVNMDNKEMARLKMDKINRAYAILGDAEKKSMYDNYGTTGNAQDTTFEEMGKKLQIMSWQRLIVSSALFIIADLFIGYHLEWAYSLYYSAKYCLPISFFFVYILFTINKTEINDNDLLKYGTYAGLFMGIFFFVVTLIIYATVPRNILPFLTNFITLLFHCLSINFNQIDYDKTFLGFSFIFIFDMSTKLYFFEKITYGRIFSFFQSAIISSHSACCIVLILKFYSIPTVISPSKFGKKMVDAIGLAFKTVFPPVLEAIMKYTYSFLILFWLLVYFVIEIVPFNFPVQHIFIIGTAFVLFRIPFSLVSSASKNKVYLFAGVYFIYTYFFASPKFAAIVSNFSVSIFLIFFLQKLYDEKDEASQTFVVDKKARFYSTIACAIFFSFMDFFVRKSLILNWKLTSTVSSAFTLSFLFSYFFVEEITTKVSQFFVEHFEKVRKEEREREERERQKEQEEQEDINIDNHNDEEVN